MTLYLEVTLNQARLPQLVAFEQRGGNLLAEVATLRALGFRLPENTDGELIGLDRIPGAQVRFDAANQRVEIDVPLSALALDTTRLGPAQATEQAVAVASPGTLLNYDLYASNSNGLDSLSASTELRLFGLGRGVLSNTAVSRGYREQGSGWRGNSVRLDTYWELSFPESAVTLTLGDTYTGFLEWTRPARIGGIRIGRNYALQPYRITAPLPEFLGEATVPSAVELYINGIRQYSGNTPTGPFQLVAVPGLTGAGNAQMRVTDAFGQVRTLDFPFYATQRLLARGLSDWSVGVGTVRRDYGIRSHAYAGNPVASATLRYGASNHLTIEAHAEAGADLSNAGIGGVWLLGTAGVLNLSHARSRWHDERGAQTTFGYAWNNQRLNFSVDSSRSHGDYRDIAALHGTPPPKRIDRGLAGATIRTLGNLSLNYVRLDSGTSSARYAGLYWNRSFASGWSANFSFNRNLDGNDDYSMYLGAAIPLGRQRQISLAWQRGRDHTNAVVDLAQPVPGDGGYGWHVQGRGGDSGSGGLAEVGWLGQHLRFDAGASRWDGFDYTYAQANGSLAWMGSSVFAARSIHDAFAVVSTGNLSGVPVMLENRVFGRTNADGELLVTPLNAWQRNKLSIDPMDLPADIRVGAVDRIATPSDRAGIRVGFELTPVRAATLVLHDGRGRPLPLGSRAHLQGSSTEAMVGYDGEAYLEDLREHNRIHVALPGGGACAITFDYLPGTGDGIPHIGPLACQETAP